MRIGDRVQVIRRTTTDGRQTTSQKSISTVRTATIVHVGNGWITVDYGKYRESVWLDDVVMVLDGRKGA